LAAKSALILQSTITAMRQLTREGNEMDWVMTFAAITLLIIIPVVAGMAIGYGMESDDER